MRIFLTFLLLALLVSSSFSYQSERAGFSIEVKGETNPYKVFSVFVMPGEEFVLKSEQATLIHTEQITVDRLDHQWRVISPAEPGGYLLTIQDDEGHEMVLNVLVSTPLAQKKGEYLNGYRIGNYPSKPLKGNPIYQRPKGLFEVNASNEDLFLTPHFQLKQFVCKQAGSSPKYLIVLERLLLKLEYLLEKANDRGFVIETFGFISGYRTPFYNASIKNVAYSRHVFGGAADIFIDQDGNGSMDDLNGDGMVDEKDVRIFYNLVSEEFGKPAYDRFKGGLGFYRRNARHHGFIHVDVRGWKARW